MSIHRSGSACSLAPSEEDALQLSRFDTSPHPPEEEPGYGPAVGLIRECNHGCNC